MFLFINTANSEKIVLALVDKDGHILKLKKIAAKYKQSEKLLVSIDKLVRSINEISGIIVVKGTLGAGKGTVVEYLKEKKGFKHYSSSGFIVEEIKRRDMPVNRDSMYQVGNDLRQKYGAGYVAGSLYSRAQKEGGICMIESIRTVGEIRTLKRKGKCYIFAVDAEPQKRYKRIKKRGGSKDNVTFEEFLENERREMISDNPNIINLENCIDIADYKFDNSGDMEALYKQVDEVLRELKIYDL